MSNTAAWINSERASPLEVKEAPTHTPGPNEILVRNRAVAINHIDCLIQKTAFHPMKYPAILGQDIAGEVVAVGPGVTGFKKGDRILGHAILYATQETRDGAFQQYTIVKTNLAASIPQWITFEAACVLPVGLSTAACALFQEQDLGLRLPAAVLAADGPPRAGSYQREIGTVLIWGGSSSVGSNAIQLAVAAGYEVVATTSQRNFSYVRALGASQVFDYHSPQVVEQLVQALGGKRLAGALDCIGFAAATTTATVVAKCEGTKRVSTTLPVPLDIPTGVNIKQIRGDELRDNHVGRSIYNAFLPWALQSGVYIPAPEPMVVGDGLESVQGAIDRLNEGVSARKVVVSLA
ncbi:zinc-binding alcohol dehydrogenase family protein [Aspergillus foveolatus]|uniref:zinc-binding alcohol dehydrogenase family protein n=1 Tax=Aspergillus foveolatus TaxID=210207 RepID=UPI003CCCB41D